ncbi:unnamed protein product [Pocillopora meandrina]|uniref:Uncharacterized protein n=1 Tax=Pocillopora meandrina TaxID=46732 RepID=A0AAU9WAD4_9CNID|nr:unnamed protein product [Pocillopora meandrina]
MILLILINLLVFSLAQDCSFEQGTCGWKNDPSSRLKWLRRQGNTPQGEGHYMLLGKGKKNFDAGLLFKTSIMDKCLSFWYKIKGAKGSAIEVFVDGRHFEDLKATKDGKWHKATFTINKVNKKIVVYGVRGKKKDSIAIDDITLSDNCGPSPPATGQPTPPPPTGQPSPPPPNTPSVPGTSPPGDCGKGPIARIVGGMEAKRGDYPWQALLQKNGYQFCGGTLIRPQWVLSAAHCVEGEKPKNIVIRMGAHYRVDKPSTSQGEQKFKVVKIITHESYNKPKDMSHDVALLKLESPATLNDFTNLACLPSSDPNPGSSCAITGWGNLKENGNQPEKLQVVQVPIMSKQTCEGYYRNELHESMVCAGFPKGGKDSCQGDSGGPMVCKGSDGRYSVHGVTSWGYGCARPGRPGVYARVSYLVKWIEGKISNN